ncbi:hypothetical protein SAMN04490179_4251 [Pseudomonas antarctica]|uniref:Phage protein n=1 Tax=Pseudomonas antarctica TaxID=219572 RepID=A0A1H0BDY5_9PSED|nr:hypothetical protein [Pseudomonas antarctica]KAF2406419.1 hypothetical protein PSAN_45940 [Pseudomonas antarctica]SDN43850.1 hypothetical protein SAMN04490179_4251 [Pseudomonas antarctica]
MSELTTLHDAITRIISERMPSVLHVEQFPELGAEVKTPALLYGITDMTLGTDRGEGKTALIGRFQSCILIEADRPKASLQAAILAAQLTTVLKDQFWGLEFVTGPPEQVHAQPEAPTLDLEQFVMWSVQWIQPFEVGELTWPWPNEPPGSLMLGINDDTKDEFFPAGDPP